MKEQLRLIANAFLKASEFGSQEAVYYILALSLSMCSREVVFVNTNHPENRIQIVKSKQDFQRLPLNSTDIYIKDTLDHYIHRPFDGAGVGKSRLIEAIYQAILRYLNFSSYNLESIKVLLCAPTVKAAFGIKGLTLHAAFILPLNQCSTELFPLSSGTRNTLYAKLKDLSLLIIDEISMVGSKTIQQVDSRLKQIFQTAKPFGGISVIVFGDFNQSAPVGDRYIIQAHSSDLYGNVIGNPLWNLFTSYQLTEIMRQKDDIKFAETLNNLANGTFSEHDYDIFESRIVHSDCEIPKDAIHLFRKATEKMKQYLLSLCKNLETKNAQGLPSDLSLSIGIKYMLTVNIDVEDGLVNDAVGILRGYDFNENGDIFSLDRFL
ncbi:ATP-dependent DNA helicase pfh1-like [Cotesia glomerata]|uniref:ATP-dependent DNA helicase pfh1-like n=1 Tax=Cotesia glomerata TaxID=32391 RepID=UPI001D030C18|nr:ATP-dependent DNA helicase pfh1-like [Cotesia glomerata]